jgi:NhaA family Na+:H+ antiporter
VILPLFALCNTAIIVGSDWVQNFAENYSLGIIFGLVIGKPIGIVLVSILVIKLGIAKLPKDMSLNKLLGAGFLGGIGFTMSIFISLLAFEDAEIINNAKFMILVASLLSGIIGFLWLKKTCK